MAVVGATKFHQNGKRIAGQGNTCFKPFARQPAGDAWPTLVLEAGPLDMQLCLLGPRVGKLG